MALKGQNKGRAGQNQAATAVADSETEPFEMETEGDAGTDTDTSAEVFPEAAAVQANTRSRRGRKPGQTQTRGPQLEWTREREEALARVLKAPKTLGDIRTARSVADALAQDPAFENEPLLTPEAVKAWVDLIKKMYADQNREHPAYLNFDRLRKRIPTMALFDAEDEAGEGVEEAAEVEAEDATEEQTED